MSGITVVTLTMQFLVSASLLTLPSMRVLLVIVTALSVLTNGLLTIHRADLGHLLNCSSVTRVNCILVIVIDVNATTSDVSDVCVTICTFASVNTFNIIALVSDPCQLTNRTSRLARCRKLF